MKRAARLLLPGLALFAAGAASGQERVAKSAPEIQPILIGAECPDVTVRTIDGTEVSLAELVRQKPTVLIVYRGGW